jgi:hypothetical protein
MGRKSLPVPVAEMDHGSTAPDFGHVTTPRLKATFYPPARSVVPRRREHRFVSGRQAWPWFLLKPWPPLPIHKAIEKETVFGGM